jgi:hypothetical protein
VTDLLMEEKNTWREGLEMFADYKPLGLANAGAFVPSNLDEYDELYGWISSLKDKSMSNWQEMMRLYSKHDIYFLLNYLLSDGKKLHNELGNPLYRHETYRKYCMRTQYQIDHFLSTADASARSFSKSNIRTKATAIQLMVAWPNASQAIVSSERQLAQRQFVTILEEIEANKMLRIVHEDVFFMEPREAAKNGEGSVFSKDDGIRVKRTMPRMNQTIEHHSFFMSAPVGSRFDVLYLEDIESEKLVQSKEMLDKLHESVAAFGPLVTPVAMPQSMVVMNNTMYSNAGVAVKKYKEMEAKGKEYAFMFPAEQGSLLNGKFFPEIDGKCPGGGVAMYPFTEKSLWTIHEASNASKAKYYGQMLGDLTSGEDATFKREWISFVNESPDKMARESNAYIGIDGSRGLEDPTGCWVWAVGPDKRLKWVGGFRRKMDPSSALFHDTVFATVMKYQNLCGRVVEVRVEQLPNQTWADLIRSELQNRGCYVPVIACRGKIEARTGRFKHSKMERIFSRWAPQLQVGKIVFPVGKRAGGVGIIAYDEKNNPYDLVDYFLDNEYDMFPASKHDDLLDAGGLMWDPDGTPLVSPPFRKRQDSNQFLKMYNKTNSWMSAG